MSKNDESIWVRIQVVLHNVVPALSVFHIQGLMTCIFLLPATTIKKVLLLYASILRLLTCIQ